MLRIGTRPELRSTCRPLSEQFTLGQQTLKLPRYSGAGVDQADVIRDHLLEQRLEEGIVRAAKNDRVAPGASSGST